jgi:hypothetical protein
MRDKTPKLAMLLRRLLEAVRDVKKAIQDHAGSVHAKKEHANQNKIEPKNIVAEIHFDEQTTEAQSAENQRQHDTQRQIRNATRAAVAAASVYAFIAILQWCAMQRQLAMSLDTAKRQFRAYVLYENGRVDISKDGRSYTVSIEIKNSGQTPAYSTEYWFNAGMMDRLPDPFRYFCPPYADLPPGRCTGEVKFRVTPDEGATDVGAGQSVCLRNTFPIASADWDSKVIYIWGYVKYWDQFQRPQFAVFIRQTSNPVAKEKSLKLANVLNWATDPEDYSGSYIKGRPIPKFPWPQEPQQPRKPSEASFQGSCPAN